MSNYPASIYAPRVLVDRVGAVYDPLKTKVFYAKDHNDPLAEIVAVETELGINPRGSFASVAARLATFIVAAGLLGGQILCGGSGVADILKLKGTSGNGTLTSPAVQVLVGNNGATTAMTFLNNGNVGIGTTGPTGLLEVKGSSGTGKIKITDTTNAQLYLTNTSDTSSSPWLIQAYQNLLLLGYDGLPSFNINPTGNVGIGTTSPTAYLHIKAGTATANTAPLKFTTGTLNTTAVAGCFEYNNTFYLTNSDNVRRSLVLSDGTHTAGLVVVGGKVKMNIAGTDYNVLVQ